MNGFHFNTSGGSKKIITQSLVIIFLLILIAAFCSRLLNGETLEDYAQAHPELAYAEEDTTSPSAEASSEGTSDDVTEEELTPVEPPTEADKSVEQDIDLTEKESQDVAASSLSGDDSINRLYSNDSYSTRTTLREDFYYEELSPSFIDKITGVSYPTAESVPEPEISYDDLRYVHVLHVGFDGESHPGILICNKQIADDLLEIFAALYDAAYPIEKIVPIDAYDGDDDLSCADNNTSCFNYRVVAGSSHLSKHAYGMAIDVNPFYNPYITYGKDGSMHISPEGAEIYADRDEPFPYKIDTEDLCYQLFTAHGFKWGGNWKSVKDYQHFEKEP